MTVSARSRRFSLYAIALFIAGLALHSLLVQRPDPKPVKVERTQERPGLIVQKAQPVPTYTPAAARFANVTLLSGREDLPAWAVPYGGEFWRRQCESGDTVDIQAAIERVSCALRPAEGGLESKGDLYAAIWNGQNLRIKAGDRGMKFQTHVVERGGHLLYESISRSHTDWAALGNTIQAQLNPALNLLEHHEARANGVEVTWIISQPPPGEGPLVIGAYATAVSEGPFAIGKVTVVDAIGQRWDVESKLADDYVHINVPEVVLAGAAYPLAIDPLIGPEFGVDDPILSPAPENQLNPGVSDGGARNGDIAFNGSHFLVVWSDRRIHPTSDDIWGTRVSLTGTVLDPYGIPISTEADIQALPTIAAYDDQFFVVWNDDRHGTNISGAIYGARVTGEGEVLDLHGILISTNAVSSDLPAGHAVATVSGGYFVAWSDVRNNAATGKDIYGARVSTDGSVLDAAGIPISQARSNQWAVDIEVSGFNLLVVWNDDRNRTSSNPSDIYGAIVTQSGSVLHPSGFPISLAANAQHGPAVASDGAGFLVVWADFRNGSMDGDIYGTPVSSSGVVQTQAGIPIHRTTNMQESVAIASNGGLYLVLWRNSAAGRDDIVGTRVTAAGVVLDPAGFSISRTPTQSETSGAIAAAADRFLVSWTAVGNYPGYQVESTMIGTDTLPLSQRVLLSSAGHRQEAPSVAANGQEYLIVWSDYRDDLTPQRQDIYGVRLDRFGAVLDPNGIVICAVTNRQLTPAAASNGRDYLVVWHDERPRVSSSDVYGARISAAGLLLDPGGIPICRATNSQTAPAVASNGSDYFVAWQDARVASQVRVYGTSVSATGEVGVPDGYRLTTVSSEQRDPTVASASGQYMVAWRDARGCSGCSDIYGTRVSAAGGLLDPTGIALSTAPGNQLAPAAAGDDHGYLVVWEDLRHNSSFFFITNSDVFATRVSLAGEILDPAAIPVAVVPENQGAPAVARYRTGFFVAWADARFGHVDGGSTDLFGARIRLDGTVVDPAGMQINTNRFYQRTPALAQQVGSECLVVCQSVRDGTLRVGGNLLNLNDPPVAPPQSHLIQEDTSLPVSLVGNDPDVDTLSYRIVRQPGHGVLTGIPPNVVYTPLPDFFGPDSFTYLVNDGEADSAPETVSVFVDPVNDPPTFTPGQSLTVLEDSGSILVPWARDVAAGPANEHEQTVSFDVHASGSHLFSVPPAIDAAGTLSFVTAQNANGMALLSVTLRDSVGLNNAGGPFQFEIVVQPVNDPPVAQPRFLGLSEDGSVSIFLTAQDIDGDYLDYSVTPPLHGTLTGTPPALTYTPPPDYYGPDRFTFTALDRSTHSAPATVTIEVFPVNDAPTATAQVFPLVTLAPQHSPVIISANNQNALVTFDASASSDPESDPLQFAWSFLGSDMPFAGGARATNALPVGDHFVQLQASDGQSTATTVFSLSVISAADAMDTVLYLIEQLDVRSSYKRPLTVLGKAARASFNADRFHPGIVLLDVLHTKLQSHAMHDDPGGAKAISDAARTIRLTLMEHWEQ